MSPDNVAHMSTVRDYYGQLCSHIRASTDRLQKIVGNPGDISEGQTNWAIGDHPVVDILVVKEDAAQRTNAQGQPSGYIPWVQPMWAYPGIHRGDAYRIAHLVHGVQRSVLPVGSSQERQVYTLSRVRHAGYVYVTDRTGNPWDGFPVSWSRRMPPQGPVVRQLQSRAAQALRAIASSLKSRRK